MLRNLSFRTKLVLVVLPPLLLLAVLAGLLVVPRVLDARAATEASEHAEIARRSMNAVDELQAERGLTGWVLVGGAGEAVELRDAARSRVDVALSELDGALASDAGHEKDAGVIAAATAAVGRVGTLRADSERVGVDPEALFDRYTAVIDALRDLNVELVSDAPDSRLVSEGSNINEFLAAKEELGRLRGTLVRRLEVGTLTVDDVGFIDGRLQASAAHLDSFRQGSADVLIGRLAEIEASEELLEAGRTITSVRLSAARGEPSSVSPLRWWTALTAQIEALDVLDDQNFDQYVQGSSELATSKRNEALSFAVIAVVAVLLTTALAVLLGRSLTRRLESIAGQAREIAGDRLPEVLEALRNPTPEALAEALPQVRSDSNDEIGAMADAFNAVLRTSVETSMDHAQQRARTVTNMLLNLGRRNQSLIDRQLAVMDELQSSQDDPDVLEGLFRIDHLVTRMRRNAENLVVLAGEQQPRSWSGAVAMLDILRGAGSEVPDLDRIDITVDPDDDLEVSGPHAVALSHLLAELVENAIAYSPPNTVVKLSADRVRGMVRVWVVDNGVGMEDAEIAEANARLASPPDIDALTADRVGFQVVGRLARQLGVAVQLQANPGGGLAALVNLPSALFNLPRRDASVHAGGGATGRTPGSELAAAHDGDRTDATGRTDASDPVEDTERAGIGFQRVAARRVMPPAAAVGSPAPAPPVPDAVEAFELPKRGRARSVEPVLAAPLGAPLEAPTGSAEGEGPQPDEELIIDLRDHVATSAGDAAAWVTADGLVKRRPGGAFAGNHRALEADSGAFRRLPTPGEDQVDEVGHRRRFANLSRLQSAVVAAREQDEPPATSPSDDVEGER